VGTQHGKIVAFAATSTGKCRPLWTGIAGEPSDSITQSADGSMMFGSADGLVAFGLPQGQG
jgi:hypothetical protein